MMKKNETQEYGRSIRLLAQWAEESVRSALYPSANAPTRLDELVENRLQHLDNLQEVVEGVVGDARFPAEVRAAWLGHARRIDELRPVWVRGMDAFERLGSPLRGSEAVQAVGMEQAVAAYPEQGLYQLWFFEGWLTAADEVE